MTTVGDLIHRFDEWFSPSLAEEWDAVGLVTGRRASEVSGVAFAVEVTPETLSWALTEQTQMLFVHHPLYLRGTTTVDGDAPKGSLVHDAIASGLAVLVAHTNADRARPGVSDALADAYGVVDTRPIEVNAADPSIGLGRVGLQIGRAHV